MAGLTTGSAAQSRPSLSNYKITQYTTNDGLPDNSVRTLHQDKRGFIWFGLVEGGVCRFDGHEFKQIICDDGTSSLAADSHIISIKEDCRGHLWIETYFSGVSCYDIDKESFVDYGAARDSVTYRFAEVFSDEVWLYNKSEGGCRRVRFSDTGIAESYALSESEGSLPSDRIFYIWRNPAGVLYIGTRKGLCRVYGDECTILEEHSFFVKSCSVDGANYHITDTGKIYTEDRSGALVLCASLPDEKDYVGGAICSRDRWHIFTQKGSWDFTFSDRKISKAPAHRTIINASLNGVYGKGGYTASGADGRMLFYNHKEDRISAFQLFSEKEKNTESYRLRFEMMHDGSLLIATHGLGVLEYNYNDGLRRHDIEDMLHDPQGNFILDVLEDRYNNIWLATKYCGVLKLTPAIAGSSYIKINEDPDKSGIANMVKMVRFIDNELWVSTADGKFHYFDEHLHKKERAGSAPVNAYCAISTQDGTKVIGSNGSGLRIGNETFRYARGVKDGIGGDKVFDVISDSKGRLWIALLDGGLNVAEKDAEGKYVFRQFFTDRFPYPSFRTMTMDGRGKIWAGTNMGVFLFDPDELLEDSTKYQEFNTRNGKLQSNQISAFETDSKGNVWIAVSGAGIACASYNEAGEVAIKHLGVSDGLINNRVRDLQRDRDGNMWIMTENGISKFIMESRSFINYHFANNNQGNTHNFGAAVILPSGMIVAGTNDGLLSIDPERIKNTPKQERDGIVFTLTEQEKNSFHTRFSALDFNEDTQYSYMLEGFDQDWSSASRNNSADYPRLPAGHYTFKVRASSKSAGLTEVSLPVSIKAPLLLSTGAIIAYLVIIFVVVFLFIKTRKENDALKTQVEEHEQVRNIWRKQIIDKNDDEFCSKLAKVMTKHFSNALFSMDDFAAEMAMSRSAFYAKVNEVTGDTPNKYMRSFRLKKATDLLLNDKSTIEEVAYMCGFKDAGYFSKLFKAEFGMTPKEYKSRATK